jgi:hypothetical protein
MRQPIPLRPDYDAALLRRLAHESKEPDQVRRLDDPCLDLRRPQPDAGGVTLQVVHDWVLRFNAYGPEGLIDRIPAER